MNIFYQLIKGLRLAVSVPAATLVHIGYRIAGQKTDWSLVIILLFTTGLVMLQNDYFDREHDKKKGKDFAYKNKNFLLTFLLSGWGLIILSTFLFFKDQSLCILLIIGIGIAYSFFRRILLLPMFVVAILSASPLLLARLENSSDHLVLLFLCVFISIFGRELLKDIEDKDVDKGYKKTLLTSGIFSEKGATIFSGICISIGGIVSFSVGGHLSQLPLAFYVSGISLIVSCVFFLMYFNKATTGKKFFDGGMFLILLALSI